MSKQSLAKIEREAARLLVPNRMTPRRKLELHRLLHNIARETKGYVEYSTLGIIHKFARGGAGDSQRHVPQM